MTPIERGIIEKAADNFGGSFDDIAVPLHSVHPLTRGPTTLSNAGKFLVMGYMVGVLMTIRDTHVDPNPVTQGDYRELLAIIRQHEDRIARHLHQ